MSQKCWFPILIFFSEAPVEYDGKEKGQTKHIFVYLFFLFI